MKVLILNYHRIFPGNHIDPKLFEQHIKILKNNFDPITLEQAVFYKKNKKAKKQSFAITFDDGWVDNFLYAYPILKKYNVPATIFVPTKLINSGNKNKNLKIKKDEIAIREIVKNGYSDQFLTWSQIQEMSDIVDIQSHAHSHAYHYCSPKIIRNFEGNLKGRENWILLSGEKIKPGDKIYKSDSVLRSKKYNPEKNNFESSLKYRKRVEKELKKSKRIIEKKTGKEPKYLAWPFGEYSNKSINLAKKVNFEACFSTNPGFIDKSDDLFQMKRFSPPRNIKLFKFSIKNKVTMEIYKYLVNGYSIIKNIK